MRDCVVVQVRQRLQSGGSSEGSSRSSDSSFMLATGVRVGDLKHNRQGSFGKDGRPSPQQPPRRRTRYAPPGDASPTAAAASPVKEPAPIDSSMLLGPNAQQILAMAKGEGGSASMGANDAALQHVIQSALRNMGGAVQNIVGPQVAGEDQDLMAAMFAAQFASQVCGGAPFAPLGLTLPALASYASPS